MSQWKSNGQEWVPVDREAWAEYRLAHPTEWQAKYPHPPAADLPHQATSIPDTVTGIGNLQDGGVEVGWQGRRREPLPPGVIARENQPQPADPALAMVGAEPDLIRGATGVVPEPVAATTAPSPVRRARGRPRKGV